MGEKQGGSLNFKTKVDIAESKARLLELKKLINDVGGISMAGGKGATDEIKAQRLAILEANKAKADTNLLVAKEKLAQAELNTQIKQNTLSKQAELAASKAQTEALRAQAVAEKELAAARKSTVEFTSSNGSREFANLTSIPSSSVSSGTAKNIELLNSDLEAGIITATEYRAAIEQIAESQAYFAKSTAATTVATEASTLSQKELTLQAARDKLLVNENTAAIKLQAKEMNAAKGSLDQRRAALSRLQGVFDGLNVAERSSPFGQRLTSVIGGLSTQVKTLEADTGRAQRNVGNYGNAFAGAASKAFSALRTVANILPGIGIAGILAFAVGPIIDYLSKLDIFKEKLSQLKANFNALNEVNSETAKSYGTQVSGLKVLYKVATDVNQSMKDRVAASLELKKEYPDSFANASTMAILNGKEKDSYDALTASILESAKAVAAKGKLADLEAKRQEAEYTKIKIDAVRSNKTEREINDLTTNYKNGSSLIKPGTRAFAEAVEAIKKSNTEEANAGYKLANDQIKIIDGQEGFVMKLAGGAKKIAAAIEGGTNLIKDPLKNFDAIIKNASQKEDIDNLQASLQAKLNALGPNDKQRSELETKLKQVEVILKKYSPKVSDDKSAENAIKRQRNQDNESLKQKTNLLDRLAELDAAYSRKSLTKDQAEIQEVKDKYAAFTKTIEEFNANPKNKNNQINITNPKKPGYINIGAQEKDSESIVAGRQAVETLRTTIEQQKAIYKEYEDYKLKAGTVAADELYGKQIGDAKSYVAYLETLKPTVEQLNSTDITVKATASGTADLLKVEQAKADKDSLVQNQKYLEQYLLDTQTFKDEQERIISKTNDEVAILTAASIKRQAELRKAGKIKEANAIKEDYENRVKIAQDLGAAEIERGILQQQQTVESYKGLSDSITSLTVTQAKLQIDQARVNLAFDKAKLSADDYATALGYIEAAERALRPDIVANGLFALSNAFGQLASASEGLDSKLSNAFKSISDFAGESGSLINGITKLTESLKTFSADKAKATEKNGGSSFLGTVSTVASMIPVAGTIISAGIKVVSGVINFFKAASESAKASAAELVAYQERLVTNQITYNEYLRDQARNQSDINELTGKELIARQAMLEIQKQQAKVDFNTLLAQGAVNGQYITGEHTEKYGGFLGIGKKTRVVQDTASIAGMNYDQINALDIQGKLTGPTKEWFEGLKKSHTEIADIDKALLDAKKATDQIYTATTANSIADAIIQGFKAGKRTMADFAEDFKSLMQDAMLSTFQTDYLKGKIDAFYKEFAEASESGGELTAAESAVLQAKYAKIITDSGTYIDNIEKVTGPLGKDSGGPTSSLSNSVIKGVTADNVNELTGALNGVRLTQRETNVIQLAGNSIMGDMYRAATSQLQELVAIKISNQQIADNTSVLGDVKTILTSIDKKTGSGAASLGANGKI